MELSLIFYYFQDTMISQGNEDEYKTLKEKYDKLQESRKKFEKILHKMPKYCEQY